MNRLSWSYREDVKKEAGRRLLENARAVAAAFIDERGLMQGDAKLTPAQVVEQAIINMQTGVQDVKEIIAPHMAKQDMTQVRQAVAKMTRH